MAIKFLQSTEDVVDFIDFLYDQNICLARSGGILRGSLLDRQAAKDALISDLTISMQGANYWIIMDSQYIILDMVSCGRWSHPRCTDRMARYPGMITHCHGREKTNAGEELLKSIRRFFKMYYAWKRCQKAGRECSFFGPHYQALDEAYTQNPEPVWLCPGYIRMVCAPENASAVTERMETLLSQYPVITYSAPVRKSARDHQAHMEVYISLLCDRRLFGIQALTELVDRLGDTPGRAIARDEKHYITADTAYRNRKYPDAPWNVYGFIENEWKGF